MSQTLSSLPIEWARNYHFEVIYWLFSGAASQPGLREESIDIGTQSIPLTCWHGLDLVSNPDGYCLYPSAVALARALPLVLGPDKRVMDVGCGCGLLSIAASKVGCEVLLVDGNSDVLQLASQNCEQNGVQPLSFVNESWNSEQTTLQPCDVVLASDTLYAYPSELFGQSMIEYLATCAPEGYLSVAGEEFARAARYLLGDRLQSETIVPWPSANTPEFNCHILHFTGNRPG